jgi:hypothetical protein
LFYTFGLVIASGVLIVALAQLFLFHSLATDIEAFFNTPSDLLTGFAITILASLALLIYNTLLSPGVLIALVCLWVFPFAATFWRKQVTMPTGSHWAFLSASSQPVVLPHQDDPFRFHFAYILGLVGGLVFCGLLLAFAIGWYLIVPAASRSTFLLASIFYYSNIILAVLLQATTAGIVAGWIRRLSVLHGLFAAFVGGCIMAAGILVINLLFGNRDNSIFIWTTFSFVINGGAFLALPVTLLVSVIAHRTHKLNRIEMPQYGR